MLILKNLVNPVYKLPRLEDQLDFMRRHDLQLLISAVAWLLITSPPSKLRRVPEAIALHVLVSNLNHKLNSQRLPRQILPRTPATLCTGYPFRKIITRPFFPRMIGERVLPVRLQKLHQLDALLIGKTRAHTNVLQVA